MSELGERYGGWALVAGASEGLGEAFADRLAARGLHVVLVARRRAQLEQVAERIRREHGVEARTLVADLSDAEAVERLDSETAALDVGLVVYNAAYSVIGPFLQQPLESLLRVIDVNCRGPVAMAHRFGRRMASRERGGGIVLMASMAAYQGAPWIATYAASKAFDVVLGEALWDEMRERGIDVVVCSAGATRTPGYVRSEPKTGRLAAPVMEPEAVVDAALCSLGHRPNVVPGWPNRLASFLMRRLLPRRAAITVMGKTTRKMYG